MCLWSTVLRSAMSWCTLDFSLLAGCALRITQIMHWGWPQEGQVILKNSQFFSVHFMEQFNYLWLNKWHQLCKWSRVSNTPNVKAFARNILREHIVPALHFERCFMKWEVIFLLSCLRGYLWDVDNKISSILCAVRSRMKTSSNCDDWENLTVTRD